MEDDTPKCPIKLRDGSGQPCGRELEWTGSSNDFSVYKCPVHGERFHRHHDNSEHYVDDGKGGKKLDHDHGGKPVHV